MIDEQSSALCAAAALTIVIHELSTFLDPDAIPDWLETEHVMLQGRAAIRAVFDGDLDEVLAVANATETGAYV